MVLVQNLYTHSFVALRKESVDRNGLGFRHYRDDVSSLSARRAWIEIMLIWNNSPTQAVALRKESVDRNNPSESLATQVLQVALRKESVDRNTTQPAIPPTS